MGYTSSDTLVNPSQGQWKLLSQRAGTSAVAAFLLYTQADLRQFLLHLAGQCPDAQANAPHINEFS